MIHTWARVSLSIPTCLVKLIGNVNKKYLEVGLAYACRECIQTYGVLKTLFTDFVNSQYTLCKQQQTKTFFSV